ncbi:hypothetical protein K3725_09650 [Leisingera sp. S132]|uniref:hypothetical protein n=1 Tax=Leisingera sp. S132 TaxID=2867016 RepID=UPI0021A48558|nr:hypothetical protein [Leisingera sp. S132]UWQ77588.1 hypothetical protein K3725_09650 [Leisingera sp. S132]
MSTELIFIGVSTCATLAVACLTFGMFVLQFNQHKHEKQVADANYKFALHEKRLKVYFALKEFLEDAAIHGRPGREATAKVLGVARKVPFIFGGDIDREVKWLIDASFSYVRAEARIERLDDLLRRGVIKPEQEKRRAELFEQQIDIEDKIFARFTSNSLTEIFNPYLKLPERL